jgi:tRNA(fMet)-specific endonuclease VapC
MLRFLFDTDHLTLYDHGHPAVVQKYDAQPAGAVGVSAVTVQESLRGRRAAVARHTSGPLHV